MDTKCSLKKLLVLILFIEIGFLGFTLFQIQKTIEIYPQGEEKNKEDFFFDPALISWEEATPNASWIERDSHAAVVFKDKIWLMGGLNGNGFVIKEDVVEYWKTPHFSDVWVSENGKDWELVAEKSPWGDRRSIQVVIFKDKMWLMGGWGPEVGYRNDVWYSEDGINWVKTISKADFSAREGHSLVVFKDKLWLIGGVRYDKRETKNDVWYSEDGINWFEATSSAQWSSRWDQTVTVFKDKLWLIGGMDFNNKTYNDIWYSEDGINWVLATDKPPWQKRQGHASVVFQDKLWVIGRFNDILNGGENDVWYSGDGFNWKKTKNNPLWLGREDFSAVIFKDKIWVMGGMDTDWNWRNDVWFSTYPD